MKTFVVAGEWDRLSVNCRHQGTRYFKNKCLLNLFSLFIPQAVLDYPKLESRQQQKILFSETCGPTTLLMVTL
jgi:hypothetical protein